MIIFNFSDAPDQKTSMTLSGRRVSFRFRKNRLIDRVSMDLAIDGDTILHAKRLVGGTNLLNSFNIAYDLGALFVHSRNNLDATLDNFVTGKTNLFYISREEYETVTA